MYKRQRIEVAVYDGLTQTDQDAIEKRIPKSFTSAEDAIAWGWEVGEQTGIFRDARHAGLAYQKVKNKAKPATSAAMWAAWIADVDRRLAEREETI